MYFVADDSAYFFNVLFYNFHHFASKQKFWQLFFFFFVYFPSFFSSLWKLYELFTLHQTIQLLNIHFQNSCLDSQKHMFFTH